MTTINVASPQEGITMFGADALRPKRHNRRVLGHQELVVALEQLKAGGRTTNADLARLLDLPTPRIAEIFNGKRLIRVDEMKTLVEAFGLEGTVEQIGPPSAENLEPMLDALLPLAPPGRLTDQSRRALAEALSYGLGLLASPLASPANGDALGVAARAAVARFREKATA
jgi:hypothetical protein